MLDIHFRSLADYLFHLFVLCWVESAESKRDDVLAGSTITATRETMPFAAHRII